ncbi:hypothetical protein [Dyadobacter sp. CY351]|uniref:hypothetical protein n=1 Tax=Dyadobacter sp. CY351 TaxID=2909337 RepID=UPI001F487119|nr:hypothetical protein [Dyadobacter sp. CY351]MCF2518522.1 hypothetical protein [Dyadobacter sp. CY351]
MGPIETLAKIARNTLPVDELVNIYTWKIENLIGRSSGLFATEEQNLLLSADTAFEQNRLLKYTVERQLATKPLHYPLLFWIIREWGGIRAFKTSEKENAQNVVKINEFYVRISTLKPLSSGLFRVISSLSKLASFWKPSDFTIYDNRAVYTLNYLIFKANEAGEAIKYFPIPGGSRNKMISEKPIELLINQELHANYHNEDVAYFEYCKLIQSLNTVLYPNFPQEPFRTEMLLFSSIAIPFKEMDGKFHNLNPKTRGRLKKNVFKKCKPLDPNQKYFPIQRILSTAASTHEETVTVSIHELNIQVGLMGKGGLPGVAFKYSVFWGNDFNSPTHTQKQAWLSQGYIVAQLKNVVDPGRKEGDPIPDNGTVTFQFIKNSNFDNQLQSNTALEQDLQLDLESLYKKIQKEINKNAPTYFSTMLGNVDPIGLVESHIEGENASDGFTVLLLLGRLDLTLEFFLVNQNKYHPLFPDLLLSTAKLRIGRL